MYKVTTSFEVNVLSMMNVVFQSLESYSIERGTRSGLRRRSSVTCGNRDSTSNLLPVSTLVNLVGTSFSRGYRS